MTDAKTTSSPANKPYFDGDTLVVPGWTFSGKDAQVPHRRSCLAEFYNGKNKFYVCRNHGSFRGLWWVHASGPGWAGDNSRASLTCATRNEVLAGKWVEAVNAGRVRIE